MEIKGAAVKAVNALGLTALVSWVWGTMLFPDRVYHLLGGGEELVLRPVTAVVFAAVAMVVIRRA